MRVSGRRMRRWTVQMRRLRGGRRTAVPVVALQYVSRVEELLGVPVTWIGVGPGRKDMVVRE